MRSRIRGLGVIGVAALGAVALSIALGLTLSRPADPAPAALLASSAGVDWSTTTTTAPPPPPPPAPVQAAAPAPKPVQHVTQHVQAPRVSRSAAGGGTCDRPSTCPQLRQCENGGSYGVGTSSRYSGAYQFDDPSMRGATPEQQDARADQMYAERGAQPWPVCGRYLR